MYLAFWIVNTWLVKTAQFLGDAQVAPCDFGEIWSQKRGHEQDLKHGPAQVGARWYS